MADAEARTRATGDLSNPDYSNVGAILHTFSANFSRLRYSYEPYEELTADQTEGA